MSEPPADSQPSKKPKVDEEYEPPAEDHSGSSDLEVYSDELNDDEPEIDLNEYLRQRQRIIQEEEEEQGSQSSEESEEEESSSSDEPPVRSRGKRRRVSSSSSSE